MSQWLTCRNCGTAFSSPRWERFCQACGGDQEACGGDQDEYEALWAALAGAAILALIILGVVFQCLT